MAIYTDADLTQIRQALLDLALGKKKASVSFSSGAGSRSVSYTQTDRPLLKQMEREIMADLGQISTRRRSVLTVSSKGL